MGLTMEFERTAGSTAAYDPYGGGVLLSTGSNVTGSAGSASADAGSMRLRAGYGMERGRSRWTPYAALAWNADRSNVGGGLEYALGSGLSLRVDYRYELAHDGDVVDNDTVEVGAAGRATEHRILLEARLGF